jgi:hypothetical protein
VISRQLPATAIVRGFKPMSDVQMPAGHLAAVSAFEANDIVALYRPPNRDSRHQRCRRRHGRALDEATERAMHCRNQSRNLINVDTISAAAPGPLTATAQPTIAAELNLCHLPMMLSSSAESRARSIVGPRR